MTDATRRIASPRDAATTRRFKVQVTAGPDAGAEAWSVDGRLVAGTAEGATLRVTDPTVSRFHVEFEAVDDGVVVRDLGSTNGTRLGAACVREVVVTDAVSLEVGRSRVQLAAGAERAPLPLSARSSFGALMGASAPMRAVYTALERAAPTSAPVLVTGESGTGKELAARAVHLASPRAGEAFEVVDCGGVPPTLIEAELFGHERGAFTGAVGEREGAFERADGGTLFLDELGELPLEVQPKLLRALGEREVRRVGARQVRKVDVRVVAATNRDLRVEVNAGRFRADLFYRLAVIQVRMPSLRDRLDDLPTLCRALLDVIGRERGVDVAGIELDAAMWQHTWPGNVRELRNYLEQLVILRVPPTFETVSPSPADPGALLAGIESLPFSAARDELMARFERLYVTRLLERTAGNVAEAARVSGISRATLFRMIRRRDLRREGD